MELQQLHPLSVHIRETLCDRRSHTLLRDSRRFEDTPFRGAKDMIRIRLRGAEMALSKTLAICPIRIQILSGT
jgi:hypothetical protein